MQVSDLKAKKINFIKTKQPVENPDAQLLRENFIPDDDMKEFPVIEEGTRIYPLSVTTYPGVLTRMTAMEAGIWAMKKCRQQHWSLELDNFQCCLANLEMDF